MSRWIGGAVGLALTWLLLVPVPTTAALWTDAEEVVAEESRAIALTPTVTCERGVGAVRLSWPAVDAPGPVTYEVLRDGTRVAGLTVANGGSATVVSLLGTLSLSKTYRLDVVNSLAQTSWTASTRVVVQSGFLGALTTCPATSYG